MRRTTIFRSKSAIPLVALAVALPVSGWAQDTTATGRQAAVHVVQRGETLWELAQRYYSDPFLWPEIYRLNTLVVEDPHWIFPGEELQLAALAAAAGERPGQPVRRVAPPPVAPGPPPSERTPTVFARQAGDDSRLARARAAASRYRALRRGEFYSAGFLTEELELPWAAVLGAVGKPTLRNLTASSAARVFDEIALELAPGATYAIGDSLLVARLDREVPGWGHLVWPTGLARVTAVAGDEARAEIVSQFDRVADGQVALPAEPFLDPGEVVPVPVDNGIVGHIVATRLRSPVPGQQLSVVFIDLGRTHGVALGDVFEVLRPLNPEMNLAEAQWEPVGVIKIVHVRDRSASGLITNVYDLGIAAGARVRLARKMPS